MTSNVGQSYPYTSESEAERSARITKLVAEREGLADKLAAEATPLDDNERWWVWKCPTRLPPPLPPRRPGEVFLGMPAPRSRLLQRDAR